MPPRRTAAPPSPSRRFLRVAAVLLGLAAVALWTQRAPILSSLAHAFVVDEPVPARADAIVVLGGGMFFRPQTAARLYAAGIAPKILVASPAVTEPGRQASQPHEGDAAIAYLGELGIPPEAIARLAPEVTSTYEEAVAVRAWAAQHGCRSLVIPTDIFHTRRVKWIFEKVLHGTGVEVCVPAIDPIRYSPDNWWRHREGRNTFRNESLKLLYYWVRY